MASFFAHVAVTLLALSPLATATRTPLDTCPIRCNKAGSDPQKWSHLHGELALARCKEPVLFDTSIFAPVDDPNTQITLRSCTTTESNTTSEIRFSPAPFTFGSPLRRRQLLNETSNSTESGNSTLAYTKLANLQGCEADTEGIRNQTDINILQFPYERKGIMAERATMATAIQKLRDYLKQQPDCKSTTMLASFRGAVVGLYVGKQVVNADANLVVEALLKAIEVSPDVSSLASEVCREDAPAAWSVGMFADFRGNISATQAAIGTWVKGECLTGYSSKIPVSRVPMTFIRRATIPQAPVVMKGLEQVGEPVTPIRRKARSNLVARDTCKYIKVDSGDSCWSLAQECGITQAQFEGFNKKDNFCNGLRPDQYVCCNKGDLPDFTPKPNADGSCSSYEIHADDSCYAIAEAHFLKSDQIDGFNKKTWGWAGCTQIQPGQKICLSKGDPPMPAAVSNAICGPTRPGTERPTNGTDIKDLNPCPLNVCCNVWGQCGLTNDFCVEAPADTGAPGTSKPGKNGCVASCGMNITNNDTPPKEFIKVGYFEAWNKNRPCLHMDVTDMDTTKYTHVHFAFPDITADYKPDVSKVQEQFDKLKKMTGIKRIISFGGWAFSTEAATFNIFRQGVTDANRVTLANNIAAFINDNGFEGVDFDWEYPSAPDIPDIPPGAVESGRQYLDFLKAVKRRLPNKSVSIAAPASYWYLKGMPIKEISEIVDYFVYMTYDLHGQWDYDNKWATEGCPSGNCLRSHINSTETRISLAMVTKAGVKSNKVVVGIASYGRSFYMSEPGCTGPDCTYTGTNKISDAAEGRCTNTSGYISNAEIRDLILQGQNDHSGIKIKQWYDAGSDSDMLVYNDQEWVAYMSDTTKGSRTNWYKGLNFGGTSDWAVDLDKDYGSDGIGEGDLDTGKNPDGGGPVCDKRDSYDTLEKISGDTGLDPYCASMYTLYVLSKSLEGSIDRYHDVDNGYDEKFDSYAKYMKKGLPETLRQYTHWLNGDGQKYFDCHFKGNGKDWTGQCPVPRDVRGGLLIGVWDIDMTLRDEDGFWKDLNDKTGILKDWIK